MERLTIRKSDFAVAKRGSDAVSILQAVDRLADIEDILGDGYDLDRLRNAVTNAPYWMCPVCCGCPGKTENGERTELCKYPEDMKLCEERQKRLLELVEADRDGKCHIGRCVECLHYEGLAVCEFLGDCGGTNWICGWFEPKKSIESTPKGEIHEDPV